ncbi:hypothetical protein Pgy4_30731 [Pseudomonas savastanoi pv. glycinea str. race 4]|uniref:Uncharacterized protein n=1 Tax=Pseudomonas savastanoi pv. glycinea str. race 4 TaxID=875330 RepID=F3CDK6_PSESG|nr:hypothetical protein Pgy4_30731 [Pseudomonas savastanoi pv. glycinea str. race 4]
MITARALHLTAFALHPHCTYTALHCTFTASPLQTLMKRNIYGQINHC